MVTLSSSLEHRLSVPGNKLNGTTRNSTFNMITGISQFQLDYFFFCTKANEALPSSMSDDDFESRLLAVVGVNKEEKSSSKSSKKVTKERDL